MDALDLLEVVETVSIPAIIETVLRKNETVMEDLNADQLARGKRSDGSDILPEYNPLTVELKKNKPGLAGVTDHVTLFDTGDHYRELYAQVQGDVIEYGSKDEKSAKLQKKYATSKGGIYGLDEDSREILVDSYLQKDTVEELERLTGL